MKGITTIAALPSGSGQAAHLPAEVGRAKLNQLCGLETITIFGLFEVRPGMRVELGGVAYVCVQGERDGDAWATKITCYRDERFKGN
jgi:hypothetical protein